VQDSHGALDEALRVLRPGGRIISPTARRWARA
jgi:ubiquinone/menaquinone biosynthesis C-methylase UbiE